MAARFAGIAGSNAAGRMAVCLVNVVCCQVEVAASGRSLIQRTATECGVSECDRKALTMRRSWPTMGCCFVKCLNLVLNVGEELFRKEFIRKSET